MSCTGWGYRLAFIRLAFIRLAFIPFIRSAFIPPVITAHMKRLPTPTEDLPGRKVRGSILD